MFLVNIRVMTQAFQDYLNNCVWMGGEFGFPFADETVSLLQDLQLGNAGVAQVVARHEATSKRQAEHGWDFENYDSDFIYSDIAEKEQWYPFQRAAKKVKAKTMHTLLSIDSMQICTVYTMYNQHACIPNMHI